MRNYYKNPRLYEPSDYWYTSKGMWRLVGIVFSMMGVAFLIQQAVQFYLTYSK